MTISQPIFGILVALTKNDVTKICQAYIWLKNICRSRNFGGLDAMYEIDIII